MGQQLAVPTGFAVNRETFVLPPWYNSKFHVTPSIISTCRLTLLSFSDGDVSVYKRIQKFDSSSTPMDFLFRQLFHRLFIVSPSFIRKNLNITDNYGDCLHANDILQTDFAKSFFNDIIMDPSNKLSPCKTLDEIDTTYHDIITNLNSKYGIDASLFSDIGTVILLVLSDCIGESFSAPSVAWVDYLSKGLRLLIDSNLTHNDYESFSLRQTMLKLNQPYIEWSEGILSTGYAPIDRQHQWLVTIVNVIIHVNTGNNLQIGITDVMDALSDYAWIHFTEEEALFMNNKYPL